MGTGTSWDFSQNLLLDHVYKETELSVREIIMQIESTRFLGHPVFHAVDPTWGSDNGVNFNFHPENEAEACMYIAGLVPYIWDVWGENYLKLFSADAIVRQMDSVFNETKKQIYSNMDIWVNNSLELENECNFMDIPMAKMMDFNPLGNEALTTPTIFKDTDSVSTFYSRFSMNTSDDRMTQATETHGSPTITGDVSTAETEKVQTFKYNIGQSQQITSTRSLGAH